MSSRMLWKNTALLESRMFTPTLKTKFVMLPKIFKYESLVSGLQSRFPLVAVRQNYLSSTSKLTATFGTWAVLHFFSLRIQSLQLQMYLARAQLL